MKWLLSLFLLSLVVFPVFAKVGYMVYWKINQEKIIALYCENKDKPEMECNGQCHLAKEINKLEDGSDNNANTPIPENLKSLWEYNAVYLFLDSYKYDSLLSKVFVIWGDNTYIVQSFYKFIEVFSFFHPPC